MSDLSPYRLDATGALVRLSDAELAQRQAEAAAFVAAPAVAVVGRADLFRRCTDDEADKIEAALQQTSTRMRNLFASVQTFRSDAPEWQLLRDTAVGLFGADRAAVLLAPSV